MGKIYVYCSKFISLTVQSDMAKNNNGQRLHGLKVTIDNKPIIHLSLCQNLYG